MYLQQFGEVIHQRAIRAVGLGRGIDDRDIRLLGDLGQRNRDAAQIVDLDIIDGLEQAGLVVEQQRSRVGRTEQRSAGGLGWLSRQVPKMQGLDGLLRGCRSGEDDGVHYQRGTGNGSEEGVFSGFPSVSFGEIGEISPVLPGAGFWG